MYVPKWGSLVPTHQASHSWILRYIFKQGIEMGNPVRQPQRVPTGELYCPWCQGVQDKYISDLLGLKAYPDGVALEEGKEAQTLTLLVG